MFLGSIFELFLLVMPSTVTLIPPIIPDTMHQLLSIDEFLAEVLELRHLLLVFGLLGNLHPSLFVVFEEHRLQDF